MIKKQIGLKKSSTVWKMLFDGFRYESATRTRVRVNFIRYWSITCRKRTKHTVEKKKEQKKSLVEKGDIAWTIKRATLKI